MKDDIMLYINIMLSDCSFIGVKMKPIHIFNFMIYFLILCYHDVFCTNTLLRYTYCRVAECCNDDWIPGNINALKHKLHEKLYGQHLAEQVVVNALSAHFTEKNPQKALTLSFHGWPGSGKNYVTKFIKEAMFFKGSQSKFIQHYTARIHFPRVQKVEEYKSNLQQWIRGNVSQCGRALIVFDEVNEMPADVLNAIKPMIDYNDQVDQVDYRRAVFIFLSNTGGSVIKDHLLALWEKGMKRSEIELSDFERIIRMGAFNEKGGFHQSDTIKSNLIDHYIPFLPMEKEHVELCITDQFHERGIHNIQQEHIDNVLRSVEWGPQPINLFSTTGCKRLSQKVPLVVAKFGLRPQTKEEL
ncbi:torsin [Carabus blaptoides fortunei]